MSASNASGLLRRGLLEGTSVVLAGVRSGGAETDGVLGALTTALTELGAGVETVEAIADGEALAEDRADAAIAAVLARVAHVDMLVVDAGTLFARAGAGRDGLRVCLEATWNVTRAVANATLIPSGQGSRIAYLAPAPGAGHHAAPCCAGLENLARTLSIEWARYGITPVTIAPGDDTEPGELAATAAYLASPAGAYFSGCVLDMRGAAAD